MRIWKLIYQNLIIYCIIVFYQNKVLNKFFSLPESNFYTHVRVAELGYIGQFPNLHNIDI